MKRMVTTVKDEIGDAIRKAFEQSGLSIKAMSEGAGLSYATTHNFLTRPRATLRTSSASRMIEALGLKFRITPRP